MGKVRKRFTVLLVAFFLVSLVMVSFGGLAQSSSSWTVQVVDENGQGYDSVGVFCPIAVDSTSAPRILYTGNDYPPYIYDILKYAIWNGSGWTTPGNTIRHRI